MCQDFPDVGTISHHLIGRETEVEVTSPSSHSQCDVGLEYEPRLLKAWAPALKLYAATLRVQGCLFCRKLQTRQTHKGNKKKHEGWPNSATEAAGRRRTDVLQAPGGLGQAKKEQEIKGCLPSLGLALFSVSCSTNLSSGDLDLCVVGRAGSPNSMVSLPPVTEKRKMDILCHHWSHGHTHPTQRTGCLGEQGTFFSCRECCGRERASIALSAVRGPGRNVQGQLSLSPRVCLGHGCPQMPPLRGSLLCLPKTEWLWSGWDNNDNDSSRVLWAQALEPRSSACVLDPIAC